MEEAIISGLAPGREADTEMVGKSTCGKGDTGSRRNAATPDNATAAVNKVVATGRLIKGAERLIHAPTGSEGLLADDAFSRQSLALRRHQRRDRSLVWCTKSAVDSPEGHL